MKKQQFEVDWKETLMRDSFWILLFVFALIFTFKGMALFAAEPNSSIKIMGVIFTLFFYLKMMGWVGFPELILKEKKDEKKKNR